MMHHTHRRQSSEWRVHSTAAAPGPWAEAGHRHLGSSSAISRPAVGRAPNRVFHCFAQLVACSRTPGGTVPDVANCHSAISSLRASATIMVFLVVLRPSCVRCRNHWTSALSG
jgi:hypothetical protein